MPEISCFTCEYENECRHRQPKLSEDNEDVFDIIYFSQSIWKRDMGGLLGFDWGEINNVMRMLNIHGSRLIYTLLQKAEEQMMKHIKESNG